MPIESQVLLMTKNGQMIARGLLDLQPLIPGNGDIVVRATDLGIHICCRKEGQDIEFLQMWANAEQTCDQIMESRFQELFKKIDLKADLKQSLLFALYRAGFKRTSGDYGNYKLDYGVGSKELAQTDVDKIVNIAMRFREAITNSPLKK